ncbi:MAG: ATP-binding protein [Lachnospiraceae bacterium]|nr:ATP-binding protein [Lachnospiraceae bacterium]
MSEYIEIDNPYTLQFSFVPPRLIARNVISSEIISNYTRKVPTYRGLFITGVRGSGKTVLLGDIRRKFEESKDWITIDLNPENDLLNALARGLYLIPEIKALFIKAKLDFSLLGIGVHLENAELIASNEEDALKLMLQVLKKSRKKLLVTIDEITYSKDVARFSHALSSYSNADYDIFVLMTGLRENIKAIKNEKSLTFLYRAKTMELDSLNITAIRSDYQETFKLKNEEADELARATRGYSLAFQALGYHYWNALCSCKPGKKIDLSRVYAELDATLAELAYDKIWDELSATDRKILRVMPSCITKEAGESAKVESIRKTLKMSSDSFTKYRSRLIDSGIIDGSQYGHLRFKLPRFEQYIANAEG